MLMTYDVESAEHAWLDLTKEDLASIKDDSVEWQQKGMYYFENCWSPSAVVSYFRDKILEHV